ncbi:MAG: hypothetical protein NVSMB26_24000 [Beijerinckiaceae bacterium]
MRRPLKPFAVEVRRSGRRAPQSFLPASEPEEAPQPDYFSSVVPSRDPDPAPSGPAPTGRVLQDLNEPKHDPLAERMLELESRLARRGRPPGSKNKVKRTRVAEWASESADVEPHLPLVMLVALPYTRRPREARFRWIKKKLHRGERWKRRLPKILW